MTKLTKVMWVALLLAFAGSVAWAGDDADTVKLFRNSGQSGSFFAKSYGYAVFPTIGKGGFVVGAAHGEGNVYARGRLLGKTTMTQLSIGFQAGGQAYSEIIFFKDKDALDRFTSGHFEFGAGVSAIAITAGASADAGTSGAGASASGTRKDAITRGGFHDGVAVFTIAKGGLMYAASVSGQKFTFEKIGK